MCKLNKSLEKRVGELVREKEVLTRAAANYEARVAENEKLQELKAELEHTKRTLKTMNSSTSKLEHILSMGKTSGDHCGLDYTGECFTSKTVFVKETTPLEPQPVISKKVPESRSRQGRFTTTCHYCYYPGHIQPRCYRYLNNLRRNVFCYSKACKKIIKKEHKCQLQKPSSSVGEEIRTQM